MFGSKFLGGNIWGVNSLDIFFFIFFCGGGGGGGANGDTISF